MAVGEYTLYRWYSNTLSLVRRVLVPVLVSSHCSYSCNKQMVAFFPENLPRRNKIRPRLVVFERCPFFFFENEKRLRVTGSAKCSEGRRLFGCCTAASSALITAGSQAAACARQPHHPQPNLFVCSLSPSSQASRAKILLLLPRHSSKLRCCCCRLLQQQQQ